jgi:uncharacterized protein YdiU (UPF0061 family)
LDLLVLTKVDPTIFFRTLSHIPAGLAALKHSFYEPTSEALDLRWQRWLSHWRAALGDDEEATSKGREMKRINPKFTWREWLIAPAYQQAEQGEYGLIHEIQQVFRHPYDEQSAVEEAKYDRLKPREFFHTGGLSHYSCSS